jgi:methylated-DNA-protein-cysteine methyltransferase related protein
VVVWIESKWRCYNVRNMKNEFQEKIYDFVSKIPKGHVATYGQAAKKCGLTSSRIVGFWLHKNTHPEKVPCHRIVFADGSLSKNYAFGGERAQRAKLISEGVEFVGEKVNLNNFQFEI